MRTKGQEVQVVVQAATIVDDQRRCKQRSRYATIGRNIGHKKTECSGSIQREGIDGYRSRVRVQSAAELEVNCSSRTTERVGVDIHDERPRKYCRRRCETQRHQQL